MTNQQFILNKLSNMYFMAQVLVFDHNEFQVKVRHAFDRWANRTYAGVYHKGNVYRDTEDNRQPNVFTWNRVCFEEENDRWDAYGHGRSPAMQIWLQTEYCKEDWN